MKTDVNPELVRVILESGSSELIAPPCSAAQLASSSARLLGRTGLTIPAGVETLLRVTNGLATNRGGLYGLRAGANEISANPQDARYVDDIGGELLPLVSDYYDMVEENESVRSSDREFPFLLIGHGDIDRFVWDPRAGDFAVIERSSTRRIESVPTFRDLIRMMVADPVFGAIDAAMGQL